MMKGLVECFLHSCWLCICHFCVDLLVEALGHDAFEERAGRHGLTISCACSEDLVEIGD